MNRIIIVAVVLIVVVAALAVLMLQPQQPAEEVTAEESAILDAIYIEMLEEELESLEIENFSSEMEDEIASDLTKFYFE
jgi:hypothetical protein